MKNLKNFTTSSLCADQLVVWGDREGKKNNIFLRLSPLTFTPLSLPTKHVMFSVTECHTKQTLSFCHLIFFQRGCGQKWQNHGSRYNTQDVQSEFCAISPCIPHKKF